MFAALNQLKNIQLPRNRAIISDIALWVVLAGLLTLGIYLLSIRMPERSGQAITLHFRNANEISKGSTVRMMGLDVGYVKDLRFKQDHVDITIQTYPHSLPIPSGATFTILFTGLAGSKSIEIDLPRTPRPTIQGQPIYRVEEPIRMKDLLSANINMTQALQEGAENITDFFGKRKPVEELQFNIHQAHQWSVVNLVFINDLNSQIRQLDKDINNSVQQAVDALGGFQRGAQTAADYTRTMQIKPKLMAASKNVHALRDSLILGASGTVKTATLYGKITKINAANSEAGYWINRAANNLRQFPFLQTLQNFEAGILGFDHFVNRANAVFGQDRKPALRQARQHIQGFNQQVLLLNSKLDNAHANKTKTRRTANPNGASGQFECNPSSRFSSSMVCQNPAYPSVAPTSHPAKSNTTASPLRSPDAATSKDSTASQDLSKPVVIVDRNGLPLITLRHPWWRKPEPNKSSASQTLPTPEPAPVKPVKKPFFLMQFFQSVWDALRFLFQ